MGSLPGGPEGAAEQTQAVQAAYPLGVLGVRLGLSRVPGGASWTKVYGVSVIAGIGFAGSYAAVRELARNAVGVLFGHAEIDVADDVTVGRLGLYVHPIVLLNTRNYYAPLILIEVDYPSAFADAAKYLAAVVELANDRKLTPDAAAGRHGLDAAFLTCDAQILRYAAATGNVHVEDAGLQEHLDLRAH